jgi:flagellar biosynthesis protein FlhF
MMQIKRFEARDIQEALRQVKEAMGPEALILSTKKVKKPSLRFGLPHRSLVEVVAAINRPVDPSPGLPPQAPSSSGLQSAGEGEGEQRKERSILQRILSMGLCPELVGGLAEEVQTLRKEVQGWSLLETYRGLLCWKLMEKVEVMDPSFEGPKIWSFIGPTGVGKTTTLVKLAALFSAKMSKKVTLITIDTYRIGAVEQLKTYAQILRVPFEIALHREELKQIIGKNIHQDLLLIDTAGRSPNHASQLEELNDFLTAHPQIENHLLLSATTKDKDLDLVVQRFRLLPIKSYIFTKIDETEEYAPMFNQLVRFRRPLSYLTNGQRVPEDIELATKGRVANLVLNQIQWN